MLNIAGLFCDLLGAILLSVPMIWDTRKMAEGIVAELHNWRAAVPWKKMPRTVTPEALALRTAKDRLVIVACLFAVFFIVITMRTVYEVGFLRDFSPPAFIAAIIDPHRNSWVVVLLRVAAFVLLATIACYLSRVPYYAAKVLLWVARGKRERKIGFVGLGILCMGFILQAWVNLLP